MEPEKHVLNFDIKCKDDVIVNIGENMVRESKVLKDMLEISSYSHNKNEVIEVNLVSSRILLRIIEWANLNSEAKKTKQQSSSSFTEPNYRNDSAIDLELWEMKFLDVDQTTLFEITMAANMLQMDNLITLCCKYVASQMNGKTTKQLREIFGIENDFTPAEEAQIQKEMQWCEDSDD